MPKTRVYELARDLKVNNKEIISYLAGLGADVKNHMSVVDDRYAELARRRFSPSAPLPGSTAKAVKPRPVGMPPRVRRRGGPGGPARRLEEDDQGLEETPAKKTASTEQATVDAAVGRENRAEAVTEQEPVSVPETELVEAKVEETPKQAVSRAPGRRAKATPVIEKEEEEPPVRPAKPKDTKPRRPRRTPDQESSKRQSKPAHERARTKPAVEVNDKPGASERKKPAASGRPRRAAQPDRSRPAAGTARRPAKRTRRRSSQRTARTTPEQRPEDKSPTAPKVLTIPETITVGDLATELDLPATTVIKTLMAEGVMAAINNLIDFEVAALAAEKLGATVKRPKKEKKRPVSISPEDDTGDLTARPPVVTILGHVDHGKTTLLDAIRESRVVETEAGGITQHIGAYQVEKDGRMITFLDTPGHEAFTSMRSRGAQVTDVAVLVVAADDGVMPQTVEALNHAKAADVPIIVAINKTDRPGANPDRVKQQLAEHDLLAEEWGGDTVTVEVSALRNVGIEDLLEMILLVADMCELKANADRPALGTVIEAELDRNRGSVATILVQSGTLRTGDIIVAGTTSGRVRAMFDYRGRNLKEAGPSTPVSILGLEEVPEAGDRVEALDDEREARQIAQKRLDEQKETHGTGRLRLTELFTKIEEGVVKDLHIVVKADVQGAVEALSSSLTKLSDDRVRVNVIHAGTGGITETDVVLAAASNAIIIGFNVRPEPATRRAAEREGVDVRLYRVIYEAIDDVKAAMSGLLDPEYEEAVLGRAEVRATFRVPNVGTIAGSYVTDGRIVRNALVRVLRDNVVIYEGKISSLKRFKDDVREVTEGYECGIGIERFNDVKEGDHLEAYHMKEVKA
jgi:translation initiation factor IF-2